MSDYYLEFIDWVVDKHGLPGNYLHINKHKDLDLLRQKFLASRIWREADDGSVFWVKNRFKYDSQSLRLNADELKEFFWIKLQAHNI